MSKTASDRRCRVCGDAFPIWLSERPADCYRHGGGAPCAEARQIAEAEAARRRACPDAFDPDGRIKPGRLGDVLRAVAQMLGPGEPRA